MFSPRRVSVAVIILALILAGCSGSKVSPRTASPPASVPPTTAAAAPTWAQTHSSAPTPSSIPTSKPTVDPQQDKKILADALITADELGEPWIKPKSVNSNSTKKGELCPGKPRETKFREAVAVDRVNFTEGTRPGVAIASFSVWTLQPGDEEGLTESVSKAAKACKTYSEGSSGLFTVGVSDFGPKSMAGADEVTGRIDRVYYDKKHTQLAFVRHALYARSGRVVSFVEHAFVMPELDPTGKNYSKAEAMLKKQLAKSKEAFD